MPIRSALPALAALLLCAGAARAIPLDHLRTTDDIGPLKVPHEGVSHILVIPTRVGVAKFPPEEWADLQAFFAEGGGPGTFRSYWKAVSGARYDPIPTLAEPVLYPDRCPVPGKPVEDCTIALDDVRLLTGGAVQAMFADLLGRVRDEQELDLSYFDVNTADGPGRDGFFDGVIIDSDIISGLAFPLQAFGASTTVPTTPRPVPERLDGGLDGGLDSGLDGGELADAGDPGPTLILGNVALAPPFEHEFAHIFGFIDLYHGPTVNDLMGSSTRVTLSAFSRQQIGWGDVVVVDGPRVIDLLPVMDGGPILRFGEPPRYLLLENRGGPLHEEWDRSPPGLYLYSIDEDTLPKQRLGFLDLVRGALYLPNAEPPYLNVNLPLRCGLFNDRSRPPCVFERPGASRPLIHASGEDTGLMVRIRDRLPRGALRIEISRWASGPPSDAEPPDAEPPDAASVESDAAPVERDAGPADAAIADAAPRDGAAGGGCDCRATAGGAAGWWLAALLAATMWIRRRSPWRSGRS